MNVVCDICDNEIRPKQQKLTCCLCESTLHRTCTSLKQDEYRSMYKAYTLDYWQCSQCEDVNDSVTTPNRAFNEDTSPNTVSNEVTSPTRGLNEVTTPTRGINEVISPARVFDEVTSSTRVINEVTSPTRVINDVHGAVSLPRNVPNECTVTDVPSTASTQTTTQNIVPILSRVQNLVSKLADVQKVLTTSTGVQSVGSTSSGVQNTASTLTGVQCVGSTSAGVGSTSAGVQNTASTSAGVQSVVSTSAGVQSVVSTSAGVQSVVSTSGVVQNVVSTTSGSVLRPNIFSSAVRSVIDRVNHTVHDIMATAHLRGPRPAHTHSGQVATNGASSEQQADTQTSAVLTVTKDKDIPDQPYGCCDMHGKVKTKISEGTRKDTVQLVITPFVDKIEDIVPPRVIIGRSKYTHDDFTFNLTRRQTDMIDESRANKKHDVQARIRFCRFNIKDVQEDLLPPGTLRVNNQFVSLNTCIDVESKKKAKQEPVDITYLLHTNLSRNNIRIMHMAKENFYMVCELARKRSLDDCLDMIALTHPEHTVDLVKEKFKQEDDSDIATTNLKASLICPIGKMRLVKPCRSKHCSHIQCIDARTILSMNQNKPTWKCQICQKPAAFDDLYIDGLFLDILASVPWDVVEVEFLKDGSWTHKRSASQIPDDKDADKENMCVMLDETIDKLDVIDLTETDDDCSPVKRTALKTNTSLMNTIVKKVHFENKTRETERVGYQGNIPVHSNRLGSQGSTCSESSSGTGSRSSTSSVSSEYSASHRPTEPSNSCRSPVFNTNYRENNSSYGRHKSRRHRPRHKRPYENSTSNYNGYNGYRNNYNSGSYRQTTIDQYSWRHYNYNSTGNYYQAPTNYFGYGQSVPVFNQ